VTLSGHSHGSRFDRRRRDAWRMAMVRLVFYGVIIGVISYWAYTMGGEHSENRNRALESRMEAMEEENERLTAETDEAIAARATALERATRYRQRYEAEVPQGEVYDIMTAVRVRLEAGVSPERITHVIGAVTNETNCGAEVASRRFIVQTEISDGRNASVSFAGNLITVSAAGEQSVNAAGNKEAWFDRSQPVGVSFTLPGGRSETVEGALPLYHSVVINDRDHRFTMAAADTRGFLLVTEQVCAYP
jgi:hypothetical protein